MIDELTSRAQNLRKAVFLDRDGVLNIPTIRNGKSYPPDSLDDFILISGVEDACFDLKEAGYLLIAVTNQPDVAQGKQKLAVIENMHKLLMDKLPLDDIHVCFHTDADQCMCRKPKPGMLLKAAEKYDIDLTKSHIVGDRWRDIEAGQSAGCQCFFIDYQYQEKRPAGQFVTVQSLKEAAQLIVTDNQ